MITENEAAHNLVKRLMAGEQGTLPMHLALLLEKSSPLHNNDEHYHKILPPELGKIRFSRATVEEVISTLCTEISRDPRWPIIAALSTTGTSKVTKTIATLLINPPRPLEVIEYGHALGILNTFLPLSLKECPNLISENELGNLRQLLALLERFADNEANKGERFTIKRDAGQLLRKLTE